MCSKGACRLAGTVFEQPVTSPPIFGGIGTLLAWWFLKGLVLWLLWNWVIWFVALPCFAVFAVCEGVAEQRAARLHAALVSASADSLRAAMDQGGWR